MGSSNGRTRQTDAQEEFCEQVRESQIFSDDVEFESIVSNDKVEDGMVTPAVSAPKRSETTTRTPRETSRNVSAEENK